MLTETNAEEPSTGGSAQLPERANQLQRDLITNGYAIIRDILTPSQIDFLRLTMKKHMKSGGWYNYGGKFQVQALHAVPGVAQVLTSEPVLHLLKEIAQPLGVALTGECDLMMNTTSTWHKDITHHPVYMDGRIFSDDGFRVYKVAFYLQDQGETSRAALKVRPKSHRQADGSSFPVITTAVRAGDAIVFDVRIDHLGQLPTSTEKLMRKVFEYLESRLRINSQKAFSQSRSIIRLFRGKADRMAVFMTFGPSEEWTRVYAEACKHRHAPVSGKLTADVLSHIAVNEVSLLQLN